MSCGHGNNIFPKENVFLQLPFWSIMAQNALKLCENWLYIGPWQMLWFVTGYFFINNKFVCTGIRELLQFPWNDWYYRWCVLDKFLIRVFIPVVFFILQAKYRLLYFGFCERLVNFHRFLLIRSMPHVFTAIDVQLIWTSDSDSSILLCSKTLGLRSHHIWWFAEIADMTIDWRHVIIFSGATFGVSCSW